MGKGLFARLFEDSQEVARGLAIQAESDLKEAVAEQIDADSGSSAADLRAVPPARQRTLVFLSMLAEEVHFPRPSDGKRMVAFDWTPIRYRNVISVLKTLSMRAPTPMAKARSALRLSTDGPERAMVTASRLRSGRFC